MSTPLERLSDDELARELKDAEQTVNELERQGIPDEDAYRTACRYEEQVVRETGRRRRGDPLQVAQEARTEIGPDLNDLADLGTLELLKHLETLGQDELRTVVEKATALTGAAITVYGQRFGKDEDPSA